MLYILVCKIPLMWARQVSCDLWWDLWCMVMCHVKQQPCKTPTRPASTGSTGWWDSPNFPNFLLGPSRTSYSLPFRQGVTMKASKGSSSPGLGSILATALVEIKGHLVVAQNRNIRKFNGLSVKCPKKWSIEPTALVCKQVTKRSMCLENSCDIL